MDLEGEYRLPAPREAVWRALNDPAVLRRCIPGCDAMERDGDRLSARVTVKIGPVKAHFTGEIRLENVVEAASCSIVGEGKGGIAGFAKGGADVRLADDGPDATILFYAANAQVGGRIARLGGRLIEGSAKKLSGRFFDRFAAEITGDAEAAAPGTAEAAAD